MVVEVSGSPDVKARVWFALTLVRPDVLRWRVILASPGPSLTPRKERRYNSW